MENIRPGFDELQASPLKGEFDHHIPVSVLKQLPRELLLRVVVNLANDVSALKSLCFTCRALAKLFRSASVQLPLSISISTNRHAMQGH